MVTEAQKETIREWAAAGAELGEIHRRIGEEFGIRMTYLDARLLVSELQVSLDRPDEDDEDEASSNEGAAEEENLAEAADALDPAGGGNVSVSVDQITQPHAMVSGRVTFSDGKSGAWYIDQMGRLGIDPDDAGYRPAQDDILAFQDQLQETLRSKGV